MQAFNGELVNARRGGIAHGPPGRSSEAESTASAGAQRLRKKHLYGATGTNLKTSASSPLSQQHDPPTESRSFGRELLYVEVAEFLFRCHGRRMACSSCSSPWCSAPGSWHRAFPTTSPTISCLGGGDEPDDTAQLRRQGARFAVADTDCVQRIKDGSGPAICSV